MSNFLSSLYILEISPLAGDFSFSRLSFCLVDHVLCFTEGFHFQEVPFIYCFSLSVCATGLIFRKWSPVPVHSSVLLFYEVQCGWFYVEVLIHLDLRFVHGNRYGSLFILLHVDIQLCQHHLLNMLSFFHLIFFTSLSKIRSS